MSYWTYIIFSAIDLICTIRLYWIDGLDEMNPIADWFLNSFGALGLTGYKAFLITMICGICFHVGKTHPVASMRILIFANILGLMVTFYQIGLMTGLV